MEYNLTPAETERFWAKVNKGSDCWTWTAGTKTNGYGQFGVRIDGKQHMARAHRVSYSIAHGAIPDGKVIDHVCINRLCVRPDHLRLTTAKQNNEHRLTTSQAALSGIRGVHWDAKANKWRAQVKHNNRTHYAGLHDTVSEAEAAAKAKRLSLFTHNDLDRAS